MGKQKCITVDTVYSLMASVTMWLRVCTR